MAHKLTNDCLSPSNIQRSSFKHFAAVFHESTVNALKYFVRNNHPEWHGTQVFVENIHKLYCMINVKTPCVGFEKRNEYREPVRAMSDFVIERLDDYLTFFKTWENSKKSGLSKPTFVACELMCESLRNISSYLLNVCGFSYVLLGNIQSDVLEKRFGRYRQMSGSNYFISVRQVLESEKKLKIYNYLSHCNMKVSDFSVFKDLDEISDCGVDHDDPIFDMLNDVSTDDVILKDNELNIIMYVSGYTDCIVHCFRRKRLAACCYEIVADSCEMPAVEVESDSEFLTLCNRGGLKYPSTYFFNFCCQLYKYYSVLKSNDENFSMLLSHHSPAKVFCLAFCNDELLCEQSHSMKPVLRVAGRSMFNMFAKNFLTEFCKPKCGKSKIAKIRSTKL